MHVRQLRSLEESDTARPGQFIFLATEVVFAIVTLLHLYLYNNQINARALIGQSAMSYCASKPMEKSRVL